MLRFGEFTLDADRYQLQRSGFPAKLEDLPLRLLMLLVSRRGEIVSRREIQEELWGPDVFIDIEQGINTAIRKVRQVLRDHPEKPRYLQTVVGKGYRFIAVDVVEGGAGETGGTRDAMPKPALDSEAFTLEELGRAILSAAGLEKLLPRQTPFGSDALAKKPDQPE
ncbi:MAG: helix-turn-helix domain-containing protein [Acidobacteriia bacterium]|nr:helix-turn-helix domain-containing protein [Terriglobia bacterium]